MSEQYWFVKQDRDAWLVLHRDGKQACRDPSTGFEPARFATVEKAQEMADVLNETHAGDTLDLGSGEESAPSPWRPIATAPRTGEHILVAWFDPPGGFGFCGGKRQSAFDVVHWFGGPATDTWDEADNGWYPSNGPDQKQEPTHWMPLAEDP